MSRPPASRTIATQLKYHRFKPAGIPSTDLEQLVLTLDEAEAIAIADLEGLYQEAAARRMDISRATFGRILASAHRKIADSIINGKLLLIEGGPVEICKHRKAPMKVAVAIQGNQIEEHFGQCSRIRLYDINPESPASADSDFPLPADMGCRSSLAPLLARQGVTHVIATRIGGGVKNAFVSHGITVIGGITGDAALAVSALANGKLTEGDVACDGNHGEDHDHGDGACCHSH